jgi:DNA-binding transcriptional MerR regulator
MDQTIRHYSPKEFASIIGVSTSTLRRWEKEGLVTSLRTPEGERSYTSDMTERYQKQKEYQAYLKSQLSKKRTSIEDAHHPQPLFHRVVENWHKIGIVMFVLSLLFTLTAGANILKNTPLEQSSWLRPIQSVLAALDRRVPEFNSLFSVGSLPRPVSADIDPASTPTPTVPPSTYSGVTLTSLRDLYTDIVARFEAFSVQTPIIKFQDTNSESSTTPTPILDITSFPHRSHSSLTNLTNSDDHTQYLYGSGRAGGQTLVGGIHANDVLTLQSSTAATGTGSGEKALKIVVGSGGETEALTVLNNGNIGFQKSNPGFTLDVGGIVNAAALYVNGTPYIGSQWTTTGNDIFYNSGNVGIGVSNTTAALDILGSLKATGLIFPTGAVAGYVLTTDANGLASWTDVSSSAGPWGLTGDNLYPDLISNNLAIGAIDSGSARLYVNGNVGIGTTSPASALDIGGSGNIRIGGLTASMGVYTDINKQLTSIAPTTGILGYWQRNGTSITPSNIGDYVGIGTTNPTANLDIAGDSTTMARLTTYSDSLNPRYDARRARGTASSPQAVQSGNAILDIAGSIYDGTQFTLSAGIQMLADGAVSTDVAPARIVFRTRPSDSLYRQERMRITSGGNVGINNDTPLALLDLRVPSTTYNGEIGSLRLSLAADTTERLAIGWDDTLNTTGAAYFQAVDSGVEYRPIYLGPSGGGVVVGNTFAPLAGSGLTVYNGLFLNRPTNDSITNPLSLTKTRNGSILQNNDEMGVITFDGFDGTNYEQSAYIFGKVDGTPANNDMPGRLGFYTRPSGGSVPLERLTIRNDGFIGIGTTNPGGKLEVSGGNLKMTSGNINLGNNYISYAGTNTGLYADANYIYSAQTFRSNMFASIDGSSGSTSYTAGISSRGGEITAYGGGAGGILQFRTGTGLGQQPEQMRIDATGNVGIGTTSPTSMLSVGASSQFQVNSTGNIVKLNNVTTSFPSSQGAANSVLRNDGAGTLTWADPTGTGVLGYWQRNGTTISPTNIGDYLGIGTTAPTVPLEIVSSATTTGVSIFTADSLSTGTGLIYSFDGLTTGKGLNLTSTSTVLSTGSLASIDWSPSGSTEIFSTGDLFKINTGTYANAGNLLALYDDGSELFSVDQSKITNSLPTEFTSPGDVSMAYDLQFTNASTANIKSDGPLTISSGEVFGSNNLTLKTYNQGSVLVDYADSGTTANNHTALQVSPVLSGAISTGTRNIFGLYNNVMSTAANSGGTTNLYGNFLLPSSTLATAGITNVFGSFIAGTATHAADAGTVNQYGLYVANGTSSTNGTSTKYGLYVEAPTGADTNVAGYFGGNVGIGTTNPSASMEIQAPNMSTVALKVRYATGVGGNLAEFYNRSGGLSTTINYDGLLYSPTLSTENLSFGSGANIITADPNRNIYLGVSGNGGSLMSYRVFKAPATAINTLAVQAVTSQTSKLFTWLDSLGVGLGVIDVAGNVGIGTTSPTSKLQISSGSIIIDAGQKLYLHGNSAYAGYIASETTGGVSDVLNINGRLGGTAITQTGGTVSMLINDSGNIGIGTTSPTSRLTVQATNSTATLGSELLTTTEDRDFSGAGNWSGTGWTVGSGVATHTAGANNFVHTFTPTAGRNYQILATVTTTTAGTLTAQIGASGEALVGGAVGTLTQHSWVITAINTTSLSFVPNATWEGTIDDVSVKEITTINPVADILDNNGYSFLEIRGNSPGNTSENIGIGKLSLSSNISGFRNTALGGQALEYNTTGSGNTGLGWKSLRLNTTGANNTAVGLYSMLYNTTGGENTGIGYSALQYNTVGSSNTAIGRTALNNSSSGNHNIAIGRSAMFTNIYGSNNVAIGNYAGNGLTDPENSVYIGYGAAGYDNNDSNSIVIGYQATGIGANTVVLGNDSITTTALKGNVGIGTTSPGASLNVVANSISTVPGLIQGYSSGQTADLLQISKNPGATPSFVFTSAGNLGIGTTAPGYTLDVKSTGTDIARFTGTNNTGCTLSDGGVIACSSDRNLKKNILETQLGLDAVMNLRPVEFNWNSQTDGDQKSLGFIAQEVEEIAPSLVMTDSNGYKQLNSIGLIPLVAKAIQEQQEILNQVSRNIGTLQDDIGEVTEQKLTLSELTTKVNAWDAILVPLQAIVQEIQNMFLAVQTQLGLVRADVDDTKEQIASLSASLNSMNVDYTSWKEAIASGSGVLGASNSALLDREATVSSLLVQNKTTTFDLTVLNKLTSGVIEIGAGIDGDEINSAGGIRFQTLSQGPIDFMNGKVVIDVDGSITAKHLKLDTTDFTSSTAGTSVLKAGKTTIQVDTTSITSDSLVFITPITLTDIPIAVTQKTMGIGFTVTIPQTIGKDLEFQWLVIN